MNIIETLDYAIEQHKKTNAMDKSGTTPYSWHLVRVMLRMHDVSDNCKKVALLHDVLEDTPVTYEELKKQFGPEIADSVKWCSKNYYNDLSFTQWMTKIANEAPPLVILCKLSDISDNLSYERMRGLIPNKSTKVFHSTPLTLQKRIDNITRKKMKLSGEMGVYDRYYKAWNILLENPLNHKYLSKIDTGDFISYHQLQSLSDYIDKGQLMDYLKLNKIHTWKFSATVKTHHDKNNNPYIAAEVNHQIGSIYQEFLAQKIEPHYIDNQCTRDSNCYHITLVNAADYHKFKKAGKLDILNTLLGMGEISFYSYGIGRADKNEASAYYTALENGDVKTWRLNHGLGTQDFHMTLGFSPKDVHGVQKNKTTIVYPNDEIWNFLLENNFTPSLKKLNLTL